MPHRRNCAKYHDAVRRSGGRRNPRRSVNRYGGCESLALPEILRGCSRLRLAYRWTDSFARVNRPLELTVGDGGLPRANPVLREATQPVAVPAAHGVVALTER